jgi:hypothetical protein
VDIGWDEHDEGEEEEPEEHRLTWPRVVHAHPLQSGVEPLELIVGPRHAPLHLHATIQCLRRVIALSLHGAAGVHRGGIKCSGLSKHIR